jgi:hypothetical protein
VERNLHKEEFHSFHRLPNIVRAKSRFGWAGLIARVEEIGRAFTFLKGEHTGKRSLGRPRHRWKDTIRIDVI